MCVLVSLTLHTRSQWSDDFEIMKNIYKKKTFKLKSIFLRRDELKVGQSMMSGIFFLFFSLRALLWCVFSVHIIIIIIIGTIVYRILCIVHVCYVIIVRLLIFFISFRLAVTNFYLTLIFFLQLCLYVWCGLCVIKASIFLFYFKSCDYFAVWFDKKIKKKRKFMMILRWEFNFDWLNVGCMDVCG